MCASDGYSSLENNIVQQKKYDKEQADIKHLKEFIASCGTYSNMRKQAESKQKIIDKMVAAGVFKPSGKGIPITIKGVLPTEPKRPEWMKVKANLGNDYRSLKNLLSEKKLNTVCEEASCPNIYECWSMGTATFMIMGDVCTRACGFCDVKTGKPGTLDLGEPARVAESVKAMELTHAVITSVNRDDLEDGGSQFFADTISEVKKLNAKRFSKKFKTILYFIN